MYILSCIYEYKRAPLMTDVLFLSKMENTWVILADDKNA